MRKFYRSDNAAVRIMTIVAYVTAFTMLKFPFAAMDDYLMSYAANGSLGDTALYNLIYPNVLFGAFLRPLYYLFPAINWYGLVLVVTQAVTFAIWVWIAQENSQNTVFHIVVLLCAGCSLFITTFTVTAYLSTISGLGLLFLGFYQKKSKVAPAAVLLMLWGFLIRKSVLLSVIILFGGHAVSILFDQCKEKRKAIGTCIAIGLLLFGFFFVGELGWTWATLPICLFCSLVAWKIIANSNSSLLPLVGPLSLFLVLCACSQAIQYTVEQVTGWQEFRNYTTARSDAVDSPYVSFGLIEEPLTQADVSETDYTMLYSWQFADKAVFSEEKLHEISNIVYEHSGEALDLKAQFLGLGAKAAFLLPVLVALALAVRGQGRRLILVSSLVCLWAMFILLVFRQRLVARVYIPLSIGSSLQMLLSSTRTNPYREIRKLTKILVNVLAFCGAGLLILQSWNLLPPQNFALQDIVAYIRSDTNKHYIVQSDVYNSAYYSGKPVFEVVPTDVFQNIIKHGSVDSFSPRQYEQMEGWNLSNPDRLLMSLVSDDDMYYVGYDASLLQRYLSQHTGQSVEVEVLYTFDCGASVYAFYVPSLSE